MNAADLRKIFTEAKPLVEQWLDIAEQFAAIRDAARVKEIDWSQVKALLKAQIADSREGADKRVRKILEKADCAASYADMLGLGAPEKNISRGEKVPRENNPHSEPEKPVHAIEPSSAIGGQTNDFVVPVQAALDDDMPVFLDRRARA